MSNSRLEALERRVEQLELKLIDQYAPGHAGESMPRLARVETSAAGRRTFDITFLNGTFTEATGTAVATYTNRQNNPIFFAHNISNTDVAAGTIVQCFRQGERWWFGHSREDATP